MVGAIGGSGYSNYYSPYGGGGAYGAYRETGGTARKFRTALSTRSQTRKKAARTR